MFAGCLKSQTGGAQELRELNLKKLHVIQMDVTSDEQVAAAVTYVSRHIPPQGICINDVYSDNERVRDLYFTLVVVVVVAAAAVVGGGSILTSHGELKSDICVLVCRQFNQNSFYFFFNGLMSTETSFIVALYSGTCLYWNCKGPKFVYIASRFCLMQILEFIFVGLQIPGTVKIFR